MARNIFQSLLITGFLLFAALPSYAQVVYTEGFDGPPLSAATIVSVAPYTNNFAFTLTQPFGWISGYYNVGNNPTNRWDRVRASANPSVTARTGIGMLRYVSDYAPSGQAASIATRTLDFRGWSTGAATVNFYMYRDSYAGYDSIQVIVTNHPIPASATWISSPLSEISGYTSIPRNSTMVPTSTAGTWQNYTFTIPVSTIPVGSRDSVYIVMIGYSSAGYNIYLDDFSVTTYPLTQTITNAAVLFQNTFTTGLGKTKQQIIGCGILADGEASAFTAGNILFNTNGTTSPSTDIQNARLWYSGSFFDLDTNSAELLGTVASPWFTNITFPGRSLVNGINYFWVTYDIQAGATKGNQVDAEFQSVDFQRFKTGTGSGGAAIITVSDTAGLHVGMFVSGTGIAGGSLVTGFSSSTIVTLNAANTGAVSGTLIFYETMLPSPATYAGSRTIDIDYCIPVYYMFRYCGCDFQDNVTGVRLDGDSSATKGIYTGYQPGWPLPGVPTGHYNSLGAPCGECGLGAIYPQNECPAIGNHLAYDLFPPALGYTAAVKADGETSYPIQAWVGNWYSSNYLAAWLDLNADGNLNNNLMISTYNGNPSSAGSQQMIPVGTLVSGSSNIVLSTVPTWGGSITVGKAIWGPGIPPGTVITSWSNPVIGMSNVASISAANSKIYIGFIGGEKLFQSGPLLQAASYTAEFCIPLSATPGPMRLRVREEYDGSNMISCQQYVWGETEDYVVGVSPLCNPASFSAPVNYNKIWLGYTDDWDDPFNWCGGVPTVSDNVIIPKYTLGFPPGRPGPKSPVIHNGTVASAGRLRIQASDSVVVDGYQSGSLTLGDSLIVEPTATLRINKSKIDSAQVHNTKVSMPTFYAPFRDGQKGRFLILFSWTDFYIKGLITGDVIDTLAFHVQRLTTPFTTGFINVTVKYSLVLLPATFLAGAAGGVLVPSAGPYTIFNGSIPSDGTPAGGYTTLKIPLIPGSFQYTSTPFAYVMLEVCYDNNLAPGGGLLLPKYSWSSYTTPYALLYGNPAIAACDMIPNDISNPASWQVSAYRPNVTFIYHRPYTSYYFESRREWVNNGAFYPGFSKVNMTGTNVNGIPNIYPQNVSGTSPTTFYDLKIDNTQHVTRKTDFTVTDSLILENGYLKLDSGTVTLTNPNANALKAVNGKLLSETAPATGMYYGNFRWNMTGATLPQTYTIPFVNNAGIAVPVTYAAQTGTHDVTFATYGTGAGNTPLPQESFGYPAPVVGNINAFNIGVNNSMNMVDRYWKIYNSSLSAQADITLRYAATEQATGGNTNMLSQRWVQNAGSFTPGPGWELPFIAGQSFVPNAVTIPGFTAFGDNIWWAVVREEMPLPVELLEFTARSLNEKVQLDWTTASELNNDRFEVERSLDLNEWKFIGKLNSQGNSIQPQYYRLYDESPVKGIQYYRLKQFDIGGRLTGYGPIAVDMTQKQFGIVSASVALSTQGIALIFNYDSNEPYTVQVVDMMGQVVAASSNNPASPGLNVMDIKANLASGMYQVILRNSTQVDTRKIFY